MRRHLILGAALLAATAALAGAGWATAPTEAQVTIDNFSFAPAEMTVAPGTRVTWSNHDDIPHTVTDSATPRAFKSPPLDSGESFSFVFTTAGTYRYFCSLHPHMQATVIVR